MQARPAPRRQDPWECSAVEAFAGESWAQVSAIPRSDQCQLVRTAGVEPAQPCGRGILSPLRLPVSPRPLLPISISYVSNIVLPRRAFARHAQNGDCLPDIARRVIEIDRSRKAAITGGVAEPSTWAMMLIGFGGVAFRSRRRVAATPKRPIGLTRMSRPLF